MADLIRSSGATPVTVDCWPHPVTTEGRVVRIEPLPPDGSLTLRELIARHWSLPPDLAVAHVDGCRIERDEWPGLRLRPGQIVRLSARVRGGGDSNPLAVVLQIAVAAVALWAPGAAAAAWGWGTVTAAGGLTFKGALLSAGIMLGGNLLINAIFPPPKPAALPPGGSPEPVYSLSGGRNRLRLYEPLLLVLGKHRLHPDLATQPYTRYLDDDQVLYQVFHAGIGAPGELVFSDWRIGDTPITSYTGVTGPTLLEGTASSFRSDVDTIQGGTLEGRDPDADPLPDYGSDQPPWVTRVSSDNTDFLALDLTGSIFRVDGRGGIVEHTVEVEVKIWAVGSDEPDEPNVSVGPLIHGKSSPFRRTVGHSPGSRGQWNVKVRRKADPSDDDKVHDDVEWAALKSYQPESGTYTNQVRAELQITATGQLHGTLDRLSAEVSRRVPVFDGAAWGGRAVSSNPAALLRWYAKGILDGGRPVAGMGLADAQIDHAALGRWHQWCAGKGLECNLVLDRQASHAEVLDIIARCGRGGWTFEAGKLSVVWEDERQPTASFTPGNIVQGSMDVAWASSGAADEIVVDYVDEDDNYERSTVRRRASGVGLVASSVRLRLPGVTSRSLAARAANLQAARQKYHRRRIKWRTGPEGQYVARGDVVYLSHSLLDGGVTGRVLSGSLTALVLSRPVQLTGDDWLLVRTADGQVHTSSVTPTVPGEVETPRVTLAAPLPFAPGSHGGEAADNTWRFYSSSNPPRKVRVLSKVPHARDEFELEAVDEVAAYYAADVPDDIADLPGLPSRTPWVAAVNFGETLLRSGSAYITRVDMLVTVGGDWRGGVVYAAPEGEPLERVAVMSAGETRCSWITASTGVHLVTVTPGTEAAPVGRPYTTRYNVLGVLKPPDPPTAFRIDVLADGTRRLHWERPADVDYVGVLIRYHRTVAEGGTLPAWDSAQALPLFEGPRRSPYETIAPPEGGWTFRARSIDEGGRLSTSEVPIHAPLGPPRGRENVYIWECPADKGWIGGTAKGAVRSNDGSDALEGDAVYDDGAPVANDPTYRWRDLTDWAAWVSWGTGKGTKAQKEMSYTTDKIDLQLEVTFGLEWDATTVPSRDETQTKSRRIDFEVETADTKAGLDGTGWTAYAGGKLTARWLRLRWRLTGDGTFVLRMDHLCYSVLAPTVTETIQDAVPTAWTTARISDISDLAGLTITGVDTVYRIPLQTLAVCTDVDVTVQYRVPDSGSLTIPQAGVHLPVVVHKGTETVSLPGGGTTTRAVVYLDLRGDQDRVLLDIVARGLRAA